MRIIVEELDDEFFFEFHLSPSEFDQLLIGENVLDEFKWDLGNYKSLNILIRKEKENICHSLKEKRQAAEKDFQRTSSEKLKRESPKNKPLRSLIAKRVWEKKLLPKRNQPKK